MIGCDNATCPYQWVSYYYYFGQNGRCVNFAMFRKLHPELFLKLQLRHGRHFLFCFFHTLYYSTPSTNQRLTIWLSQFHISCVGVKTPLPDKWYCPECIKTKNASSEKRKGRKKWLNTTYRDVIEFLLTKHKWQRLTHTISKSCPGNRFAGSFWITVAVVLCTSAFSLNLLEETYYRNWSASLRQPSNRAVQSRGAVTSNTKRSLAFGFHHWTKRS